MDRQIASETGNVGGEPLFLWLASDTAAFSGRLTRARELSHRSLELAVHSSVKEWVAEEHLDAALREAEFGESRQASEHIKSALTLASTRDVQTLAALALARAGHNSESQRIANRLAAAYPSNTLLQSYWLPTIRASIEFNRGNAAKAVALLASAEPYELGSFNPLGGTLYPAYVRGEAYLLLRQGKEAVAEFQKFIDHRGVVVNFSLGALARLGLARGYLLQGETDNARAAFQDFFTMWKDADPDIPILKQAKAEYAKLQ